MAPRRPRAASKTPAGPPVPAAPAAGLGESLLPGLEPVAAAAEGAASVPVSAEDAARDDQPHHLGHRDRLRQRYLTSGPDSLQDYELLELLLFSAIPRRDVKPLAKQLLKSFGSLWGVVNAPPDQLRKSFNLTDGSIVALTVVGAAALRMARQQIINRPVLGNWQALLDYCQGVMVNQTTEQFRLLFLDRKNQLIADEVQQRGTIDHTPVYPREIVRRALDLGACAVILVHNHPSGDPSPSRADITMTNEIKRAAEAMGIAIHDHLIIGHGRHVSFKAQGLL